MGNGPRDWSPPGYWDGASSGRSGAPVGPRMTATPPVPRLRRSFLGILSLIVGVAALSLTIAPIWTHVTGRLVWTTIGLTAIYFGCVHLWRRRRGVAYGRVTASIGIATGSAATALLVWGVLWAQVPGVPAPPQVALAGQLGPTAEVGPELSMPVQTPTHAASKSPVPTDDHSYKLRAGRVVPPAPNATEVDPAYQLQANLVAAAYEICIGLRSYQERYGHHPDSLSVASDGRVTTTEATFSAVLQAYMRISYVPDAPDGTALLTVADVESGLAMSCVKSGDEGWITNS